MLHIKRFRVVDFKANKIAKRTDRVTTNGAVDLGVCNPGAGGLFLLSAELCARMSRVDRF